MKKLISASIGIAVLLVVLIAIIWLASGTGPDDAPTDVRTVDIDITEQ